MKIRELAQQWEETAKGRLTKTEYAIHLDVEAAARLAAIRATRDEIGFAKKCLRNIAGAGRFSSDRTVREYWDALWSK